MAINELHTVGVSEEFRDKIEGVNPQFIKESLLWARENTWKVFAEIRNQIKEGLSEIEARQIAYDIFSAHGVKKHWHKPQIRFGPGTVMTFNDPLQLEYRLQENDMVYLDLGPVWLDAESNIEYEGDVGDSFVFGENIEAEKCAQDARDLFQLGKSKWLSEPLVSGTEIYSDIKQEAEKRGYVFLDNVVGHRLSDFPHHQYSREKLPQIEFKPRSYLWILELQIIRPDLKFGAFYEDLLF